jgi:hypothetical protein
MAVPHADIGQRTANREQTQIPPPKRISDDLEIAVIDVCASSTQAKRCQDEHREKLKREKT